MVAKGERRRKDAHLAAREAEQNEAAAMSTPYRMFLVSCAVGSAVPLILGVVALAFLPSIAATAYLGLLLLLAVLPLRRISDRFARDMCLAAQHWFSIRVICDEAKFDKPGPYVIGTRRTPAPRAVSFPALCCAHIIPRRLRNAGLEPHGVLPTALPPTFNSLVHCLPPGIGRCHALATSTVFHVPVMRHVWWSIDIRPASREMFSRLLADGLSVAISPGGVTECLHMAPGVEVAYLRKRLGFVRIGLQHGCANPDNADASPTHRRRGGSSACGPPGGVPVHAVPQRTGCRLCRAPLCPAFAFGQTDCFGYLRPGPPLVPAAAVKWLASVLGFAPLIIWGKWGTALPYDNPNTVVIGDPIELPRIQTPTKEECQRYLDVYIEQLRALFYKYRAEAGYPELELRIL